MPPAAQEDPPSGQIGYLEHHPAQCVLGAVRSTGDAAGNKIDRVPFFQQLLSTVGIQTVNPEANKYIPAGDDEVP